MALEIEKLKSATLEIRISRFYLGEEILARNESANRKETDASWQGRQIHSCETTRGDDSLPVCFASFSMRQCASICKSLSPRCSSSPLLFAPSHARAYVFVRKSISRLIRYKFSIAGNDCPDSGVADARLTLVTLSYVPVLSLTSARDGDRAAAPRPPPSCHTRANNNTRGKCCHNSHAADASACSFYTSRAAAVRKRVSRATSRAPDDAWMGNVASPTRQAGRDRGENK